MNYFKRMICGISFSLVALFSTSVFAVVVEWTDWQSSTSNSALGVIDLGYEVVDVEYIGTGTHGFVETGAGRNYWTGTAYTNGMVDNAPTAADLIALYGGGTVTINFSETVTDPFLAINSWNGNVVEFGEPIAFDSFGQGYWGSGYPQINATGTGFTGVGELHGVLSFKGNYDSLSFTHTTEYWHGFTVGVSPVPEPSTWLLFTLGTVGMIFWVGMRRKEQKETVALPA